MAANEMQEYTVTLSGIEHTMLLSKEDADRYGDLVTKSSSTSNKAKQPSNKSTG